MRKKMWKEIKWWTKKKNWTWRTEEKKLERSLSREEKEELVRSKKKVKAVSHAGFCDGHSPGPASPNHDGGSWNLNASFKDRLVGEIPGAFS